MSRLGRLTRGQPAGRSEDRHATLLRLEQRGAVLEARISGLEAQNAALEAFAATAAHQLAEPLVIVESAAILVSEDLDDQVDPTLRRRLAGIGIVAARCRRQIDALLLDARSADSPPELTPVDVAEVVGGVLDLLAPRIEQRQATVDVGALPVVCAGEGVLTVIFENLLSNALKYGPRGHGRIGVDAEPAGEAGWRFCVTSEGPPIPAAEAERLFEPFCRGTNERRAPGHGLGLAICERLARRLGGSIGVTSGHSSNTFHFTLPAFS